MPPGSSPESSIPRIIETKQQQQRRVFALGSMRFSVSHRRLCDAFLDGLNWALEGFVYLIGPLLILLALFIISLLTYTFFTILLPMLRLKHADSSLSNVYLGLHCTWVVFLVVNILFNYALCVITQNKGSNYDKLVRELAEATDFPFPETPEELARYRRDYEDRMVLRMRCRQARHVDAAATASSETAGSTAGSTNGVTHRRTGATSPTGSALIAANDQATSSAPKSAKASTPAPHLRRWMIMTPFEWGYCMNSKQPKPPRSHYDHVTKTLVLNLDHYCPWMFNVIGYFNYRYFVNFLVFIFVGMLYGSLLCLEPFLLADTGMYKEQVQLQRQARKAEKTLARLAPMLPFREEKMLVTLAFMLCVALLCAIVFLGGFHIYLTLTAQTTIEFHGNWANRKRAKKVGKKWKNPYDLGWKRNWQQIYGTQYWLIAMLPSAREPAFLPIPLADHTGRRRYAQKGVKDEQASNHSADNIV